jgi:hypothetical protein
MPARESLAKTRIFSFSRKKTKKNRIMTRRVFDLTQHYWRAKNISGGLPISGGFLADLTNFAWVCFCLADQADSGGFGVSISKNQLFSHFLPWNHFLIPPPPLPPRLY